MLNDARAKAQQLLDALRAHQAELAAHQPNDMLPAQLEQGRMALQRAIESAERALLNLDQAQQIAAVDMN